MQIHQSAEDYLETILMLNQRMGRVRSIDVVNELGYTKASVSIAMKKLRENGYIAVDGEGNLTLLEPGREIAERIYSRHRLLTHFFVQLGVDEEVAAEDACIGKDKERDQQPVNALCSGQKLEDKYLAVFGRVFRQNARSRDAGFSYADS